MSSQMKNCSVFFAFAIVCACWFHVDINCHGQVNDDNHPIRFATFNTAMNRASADALVTELESGSSEQAMKIAEVIQRVRPHVIALNEVDFDPQHKAIKLFKQNYLQKNQNGQAAINYDYVYCASVNTGVDSGMDLDRNGQSKGPGDAYGFGQFPGQYGMAILSMYPIKQDHVRTFQKFLWKDMPQAAWPMLPDSGEHYYPQPIREKFRLSSKSHWDVPIDIDGQTIHFLVAHPTPPVFDGEEDRNGRRNHDEIRFWADYIDPSKSDYVYDDNGKKGGLEKDAHFVIAGDMNADPHDGDSFDSAINLLLKHPLIRTEPVPKSTGAVDAAKTQGGKNSEQRGDPSFDTGDFGDDAVGNLRIDYVLPSKTLDVTDAGVFWPKKTEAGSEAVEASDHRLVWIDIKLQN
jgi:endonuclease/exonuclease/phosphatase family metal-dependent hydrolase